MKKIFLNILIMAIVVFYYGSLSLASQSKTINVTATVPTITDGLNVTVSKVDANTGTWLQSDPNIPIDFGTLTLDMAFNVFRPAVYYAVDIGVTNNAGGAWTVTHTRNSIQKDAVNNLDGNVNVTFMKQTSASAATQLQKVSFANSNNIAYTQAQLNGGWLRIYYGIGSGSGDATGVLPIGLDKPAGTYTGSVVITMTP